MTARRTPRTTSNHGRRIQRLQIILVPVWIVLIAATGTPTAVSLKTSKSTTGLVPHNRPRLLMDSRSIVLDSVASLLPSFYQSKSKVEKQQVHSQALEKDMTLHHDGSSATSDNEPRILNEPTAAGDTNPEIGQFTLDHESSSHPSLILRRLGEGAIQMVSCSIVHNKTLHGPNPISFGVVRRRPPRRMSL